MASGLEHGAAAELEELRGALAALRADVERAP
jgi:hypothetical protein